MTTNIEAHQNIFQKKSWVIVLAIFCSVLWGSAFPVLKITYSEMNIASGDLYGKILIAGARFFIAGIMILIYALITMKEKVRIKSGRDLARVAVLGVVQTSLNYFFFYIGLANTTASKGAIINSLSNFLIIILAHFIYSNDKLNSNKIKGIIFGLLGVLIVNLGSGLNLGFTFRGEGFMFIAVITAVLSSFMVKSFSRSMHPVLLSAYQLIFGGFVMLVVAAGGTYDTLKLTPISVGLFIYSALLSAVAFTLWYTLLKYNKPGEITMFRFLIPVSGSLLSVIFLKEKFTLNVALSLISIVAGIILVNKEPVKDKIAARAEKSME